MNHKWRLNAMGFLKKLWQSTKTHVIQFSKGIRDAFSWKKTAEVLQQPEVSSKIKPLLLLNGITLGLTSISQHLLFPIINSLIGSGTAYTVLENANFMLWTLPIQIIVGILNVYHWGEISDALQANTPTQDNNDGFIKKFTLASSKLYRVLLIPGLILQGFLINKIPVVGPALHFINNALLFSFYQFEYHWDHLKWPLPQQMQQFEKHWAYFIGFGVPLASLTYFLAPTYAGAVFAATIPGFMIMAKHSSIQENLNGRFYPSELFLNRLPFFTPIAKIGIIPIMIAHRSCKKNSPLLSGGNQSALTSFHRGDLQGEPLLSSQNSRFSQGGFSVEKSNVHFENTNTLRDKSNLGDKIEKSSSKEDASLPQNRHTPHFDAKQNRFKAGKLKVRFQDSATVASQRSHLSEPRQ